MLQINAINAATEAACLILSVDETVKNPKVVCKQFFLLKVFFMPNLVNILMCQDCGLMGTC